MKIAYKQFNVISRNIRRNISGLFTHFFSRLRRAEHVFMVLAAIVIGILGAFGAIIFRYMIILSHNQFFSVEIQNMGWVEGLSWWEKVLIPVAGEIRMGSRQ